MHKIKLLFVIGTRPEAIKMAPLIQKAKEMTHIFETIICSTGQHKEMLTQVFSTFEIVPDIDLEIMKDGQDLFDITTSIMKKMKHMIENYQPDIVLVHGDTSSAMSTSMAAFYLNKKIGHVEAGLRTGLIRSPFPEEFNRQMIGKVSDLHFAPTKLSKENLLNEGVNKKNICLTGNTVIDSMFYVLDKIKDTSSLSTKVFEEMYGYLNFDIEKVKYILITGHRRENFGDGFIDICNSLKELSVTYPNFKFVYPVHLNPNVQKPVNQILSKLDNVYLIPPQNYENFLFLLNNCFLVLTDSGGIQEEAPSLGKPVLVMRDVTERPEAVDAGTVKVIGTSKGSIINHVSELIENEGEYKKMSSAHNPYGDGKASERILSSIIDYFK